MSSYRARQDRKRLRQQLRNEQRRHEAELGEVQIQLAQAEHALARLRFEQSVRWDAPRPIAYERAPSPPVPHIRLQLLAKREVIDNALLRQGPDRLRRMIEDRTARELAQAMIREGMVSIETAEVPLQRGSFDHEFDWAVYVGRPVPVRHHAEAAR